MRHIFHLLTFEAIFDAIHGLILCLNHRTNHSAAFYPPHYFHRSLLIAQVVVINLNWVDLVLNTKGLHHRYSAYLEALHN